MTPPSGAEVFLKRTTEELTTTARSLLLLISGVWNCYHTTVWFPEVSYSRRRE